MALAGTTYRLPLPNIAPAEIERFQSPGVAA